jgi:hypothetical protein
MKLTIEIDISNIDTSAQIAEILHTFARRLETNEYIETMREDQTGPVITRGCADPITGSLVGTLIIKEES